jgi:SAM-dependent methyltransferase
MSVILPDVDACLSFGAEGWGAVGDWLRAIGVTWEASQPFERLAALADGVHYSPILKWHLRRQRGPAVIAMRMFVYWDPVTPDEARAALGDALSLDTLLAAGVLTTTTGGDIRSPYLMRFAGKVFILSDDVHDGGEAVMGPGQTTRGLARISFPRDRVGRALDVGCGAGTMALWLARACDHVVATDISARAGTFVRINGWLNRITNVEFRLGDMFAPVAGESFDLIISQPPFVPRDDSAPATTFLFGGSRGDELPMRVLEGVSAHLSPGGMAIVYVEWPIVEGDPPLEDRVRAAVGDAPARSLLLMQWADGDVDAHCALYADIGHGSKDEACERDAIRRREHFERAKIRGLRPTFTVVRRDPPGSSLGWTSTVQGGAFVDARPSREQLESALAARDLVARGRGVLEDARLRLPEGVTFLDRGDHVEATLEGGGFSGPMKMSAGTVRLIGFIHEADRVKAGIEALVAAESLTMADIADTALQTVEFALLHGLLELAPP